VISGAVHVIAIMPGMNCCLLRIPGHAPTPDASSALSESTTFDNAKAF
jgi:hypothetical protein